MGAHRHHGRYPFEYALFFAAYYIVNAAYQGFITVYFADQGLTMRQIGMMMSAVPLVSILTQPMWGAVGDKSKNRTNILRVLVGASAVLVLSFYVSGAFWFLIIMLSLYAGFYIAVQPMGDSIVLEALGNERKPFGPLRLTGCLAFGVASYFAGRFFEGRLHAVPAVTAVLLALAFLATFGLPNVAGHDRKREKAKIRTLFKNRELVTLLLFLTLLQMSMSLFYGFFSIHYVALPGGTTKLLGLCFLISAYSEIPFLLFADRLIDRFGAGKLMCVSACVMTVRWVILGFITNANIILASQLLHGWGFIVMTVSMAKYMNEHVEDELKARAQMMLGVVGFGIARTVGTFAGGFLVDRLGFQGTMLINSGFTLLALAIFAPRFLRRKEKYT